jgi:GntR family transcriptional regulator
MLPIEIDKNSPMPIYYQLKQGIVNLIESGALQPKDPIPSENALSQVYDISPMTVRQAMAELVNEGYVHRKRGLGTFVSVRRMQRQIEQLTSFSEDMLSRGLTPGSRILLYEQASPPGEIVGWSGITQNTKLLRIKRVRLADGKPVGIHDAYLNTQKVSVSLNELEESQSLYKVFDKKGVSLAEGEVKIEAIAATEECARLLNATPGEPLLRTIRLSWDADGELVEYVIAVYHADVYQYTIHLKR